MSPGWQSMQDSQVTPRLLHRRPSRADGHSAAREPVDQGRRARVRPHRRGDEQAPLRARRDHDHGRTGAAEEHQRLSDRRHAHARRDRGRHHGPHPHPVVRRALATAPTAHRPRRRRLGVRHRGLHRDPAHDRDDRRTAGDARDRYRLRDPDARACRRGGRDRAVAASDPGDVTRPRARRCSSSRSTPSSRSPRCTTPRCRCSVSSVCCSTGRCRRDLREQHHRDARGARHPRVQVARRRRTSFARARSVASSCGSGRSRHARRSRSPSRVSWCSRRASRSRASWCCRPTRSSG